MIVLRFKVQCQPERVEEALVAFAAVPAASRAVDGVISFDIGRDVLDPNSIIAVEVFEDAAARERQESLPEVARACSRGSWPPHPKRRCLRSRRPRTRSPPPDVPPIPRLQGRSDSSDRSRSRRFRSRLRASASPVKHGTPAQDDG
jgi:quinol monooxygenase YgiN